MKPWMLVAGVSLLAFSLVSAHIADFLTLQIIFNGEDVSSILLASVLSVLGTSFLIKGVLKR